MPEPDAVRPRFQAMERHMRWIPGWQPLDEPEAILPTALEMPDDASLAARRIDALIVGVLTIGLAVAAATVPVGLVLLLGCWKRSEDPDYRLLIRAETDGGEAEQWEEEFEMVLGPVKTAVFAVYYVCNIIFLLVLTSWSKAENLMLGGVGLDWEVIWMWLVVVLSADVVGYSFRAAQAAIMKRHIKVTDPALSMVMSVFPILGPRVDLLKDCLFAGSVFQLAVCQPDDSWRRTAGFLIGNAALLTIFLPAPFLFWFATTRRDLASEFWPALVARLRTTAAEKQERSQQVSPSQRDGDVCSEEQTMWDWVKQKGMGFAVPKLVAQCTQSRLWTALGEDLPQAILAIAAMVVFEQYSGMLLFNLVVSGGKILAVFSLRESIWQTELYLVDPVTCAAFVVSCGREISEQVLHDVAKKGWVDHVAALLSAGVHKDAQNEFGDTPLHEAAANGHADCVELLLKAGADKDAQNEFAGSTPLHLAARDGHFDCMELLLKAGVDKGLKDDDGQTALDRAANEACKALLEKASGSDTRT